MGSVKVAVSLPESLFARLETMAAQADVPRSQLVAAALKDYLGRREMEQVRERINAAYADGLDDDERAALEAHRLLQRGVAPHDAW